MTKKALENQMNQIKKQKKHLQVKIKEQAICRNKSHFFKEYKQSKYCSKMNK